MASLRKQAARNEIQGQIRKEAQHSLITKQLKKKKNKIKKKIESSVQIENKTAFQAVPLGKILTKIDVKCIDVYLSVRTVACSCDWVEDIMYNQF